MMYGQDLIDQIGYDKFCSAVSQGLQGRKRIGYTYVSTKEREEHLYNTVIRPKEDRILKLYTLEQLKERKYDPTDISTLHSNKHYEGMPVRIIRELQEGRIFKDL